VLNLFTGAAEDEATGAAGDGVTGDGVAGVTLPGATSPGVTWSKSNST
jgi:hypothetical protein